VEWCLLSFDVWLRASNLVVVSCLAVSTTVVELIIMTCLSMLSNSVRVMQCMLDICELSPADLDAKSHCVKSVAMSIGPRYNCCYAVLALCGKVLA